MYIRFHVPEKNNIVRNTKARFHGFYGTFALEKVFYKITEKL